MTRKHWLTYLLLNILVSALVTLGVLFLYDRYWHANQITFPLPPTSLPTLSLFNLPANTLQVLVVGMGDLETERIILRYNGPLALDLSNWRIKDEEGHLFVFPTFILAAGGAVQIHTTSGEDTPVDLYWELSQPVWQSGETLTLLDPSGTPRLIYTIP